MKLEDYNKEVILDDLERLQYLYGLKREIRYNLQRDEEIRTESVADHVYGMHLLAQYFLPLEDPSNIWNHLKIFKIITVHDIGEVETGDILTQDKTEAMRKKETLALETVYQKSPKLMQKELRELLTEYEERDSIESKFVKAIDRIEPTVHLHDPKTSATLKINHTQYDKSNNIEKGHTVEFPFINKFIIEGDENLNKLDLFWKISNKIVDEC